MFLERLVDKISVKYRKDKVSLDYANEVIDELGIGELVQIFSTGRIFVNLFDTVSTEVNYHYALRVVDNDISYIIDTTKLCDRVLKQEEYLSRIENDNPNREIFIELYCDNSIPVKR